MAKRVKRKTSGRTVAGKAKGASSRPVAKGVSGGGRAGVAMRKGGAAKAVLAKASAGKKKSMAGVKGGVGRELKPVATGMLPARSAVKASDTWDLSPLFPDVPAWEKGYAEATEMVAGYGRFKGRLGESAGVLREFFEFDTRFSRLLDRVANFASLRSAEDQGDSVAQSLRGRVSHLSTVAGEAASYFTPEVMALPQATLDAFLESKELSEWKLAIERIVRYRPHTLSLAEERLLAMQGQMAEAAGLIFRQLNDADMKFGTIKDDKGVTLELGHSSLHAMMLSPSRKVRETAFDQYYAQYDAHRNAISASLASSVHRDIYYARARNHKTAREAALFPDRVPVSVYDNLVSSVRANLPAVHRYLEVRKRALGLKDLHFYDTYVPIVGDVRKRHTWDQAVEAVCASLAPMGGEYVGALKEGLTTARWADRYPNAGKQSGAFSSGVYDSPPYILMNFRDDVLEHVFTLTHEAGHSMHSWYSKRNQPYQYSDYVIFVAEVASTFNEQLLARHLMDNAASERERAYLITREIDAIRGTIIRQTMFAEFERDIHAMAEAGEALTVTSLRATYRKLLEAYFGPGFAIDAALELECLRIPHFYRAFYVYKYATGLAAAVALSEGVLAKRPGALDRYLSFLKSGGSDYPLELLKGAGVDMSTPGPVNAALGRFGELVKELDGLV